MNRSLKIRLEALKTLSPATENQKKVFDSWDEGLNLCLAGSAGTGKTFLSMFLGLEDVLDKETPYEKLVIIRSVVPTRDIGFLPGSEEEKKNAYTSPYRGIITELVSDPEGWDKLITQGDIQFLTTSFIRGTTISNAIILIDEMQNLNFHELDSVITRVGENCRFIMCGDYYQTDFDKEKDKNGILQFLEIIDRMNRFATIEFSWQDIVRSGLVRDYIMTKEHIGIKG
jgi:predicted ribonuclease YlaK